MHRLIVAPLLALALIVATATPREASADASTLCRSVSMIALAPFDIVLSPFITAHDMHYGLSEVGDEPVIRVVAALPGYVWLNTVQVGGAFLRVITGAIEFVPGLFTLFREGGDKPQFQSQDETWQLYSNDIGPCPIRFGSSYNSINEG